MPSKAKKRQKRRSRAKVRAAMYEQQWYPDSEDSGHITEYENDGVDDVPQKPDSGDVESGIPEQDDSELSGSSIPKKPTIWGIPPPLHTSDIATPFGIVNFDDSPYHWYMLVCEYFRAAAEKYQDLSLCKSCIILLPFDDMIDGCVSWSDWPQHDCKRCHDKGLDCEKLEDTAVGRSIQEKSRFLTALYATNNSLKHFIFLYMLGLTEHGIRETVRHFRNEFKEALIETKLLRLTSHDSVQSSTPLKSDQMESRFQKIEDLLGKLVEKTEHDQERLAALERGIRNVKLAVQDI